MGGERLEGEVDGVAEGEAGWEWREARERGELGAEWTSREGGVDGALDSCRGDGSGVVGGGVDVDGGVDSVMLVGAMTGGWADRCWSTVVWGSGSGGSEHDEGDGGPCAAEKRRATTRATGRCRPHHWLFPSTDEREDRRAAGEREGARGAERGRRLAWPGQVHPLLAQQGRWASLPSHQRSLAVDSAPLPWTSQAMKGKRIGGRKSAESPELFAEGGRGAGPTRRRPPLILSCRTGAMAE